MKKNKEEISDILRKGLSAGADEAFKKKDKVFRKRLYDGKAIRRHKKRLGIALNKKDKIYKDEDEKEKEVDNA